MSMESVVQIRMDTETKNAVEKLYKELGTSFAEAVRIFAKKSIDEQAMPFSIKRIKCFKSFGSLNKYANKNLIGKEKDIISEALVGKYVKNNWYKLCFEIFITRWY